MLVGTVEVTLLVLLVVILAGPLIAFGSPECPI